MKWWVVVLAPIAAIVWLEIFLRYQVEAIILLMAVGGWWDYMRRRQKLKPPED